MKGHSNYVDYNFTSPVGCMYSADYPVFDRP